MKKTAAVLGRLSKFMRFISWHIYGKRISAIKNKKLLRVLLIAPSYDTYRFGLPPYNIAYLANYLKGWEGISLQIINGDEYDLETLQEIIAYSGYDVFATGGMITLSGYFKTLYSASQKYNPSAWRILGGPITQTDLSYLFATIPMNVAVIGEGEKTLAELLDLFLKHKLKKTTPVSEEYELIDGTAYVNKDGNVTTTKPRELINLATTDILPAWEYFDIDRYLKWNPLKFFIDLPGNMPQRQFSILIGRGCPYNCAFCGSPFGKKVRALPAEKVIKEIEGLVNRYRINVLYIMSETFFFKKKQILEFCHQLKIHSLGIRWICNLRADMLDDDIAQAMKNAGCDHITFGIESGSNRILDLMRKGTTVQQNAVAMECARKAGIYPGGAIMFGYLDETHEDIQCTVNFMLEGNHVPSSASIATAIPGTILYKQALERGIIKNVDEYLAKLDGRIDVCDIPKVNLSKIPNEIFWSVVVTEYRRLMTGLFRNGTAHLKEKNIDGIPQILVQCPFCASQISIFPLTVHHDLGTKILCRCCRRIVWMDPFSQPGYQEHGQALKEFAYKISAEDATYAYVGYNDSSRWLLQLNFWSMNPERLICIFDTSNDTMPRKEYNVDILPFSEIKNVNPKYLFVIQSIEKEKIIRSLLGMGYTAEQIIPLYPT